MTFLDGLREGMYTCTKCLETKARDAFGTARGRPTTRCRACLNDATLAWYYRNRERIAQARKDLSKAWYAGASQETKRARLDAKIQRYHDDPVVRAKKKDYDARHYAKKKGLNNDEDATQ